MTTIFQTPLGFIVTSRQWIPLKSNWISILFSLFSSWKSKLFWIIARSNSNASFHFLECVTFSFWQNTLSTPDNQMTTATRKLANCMSQYRRREVKILTNGPRDHYGHYAENSLKIGFITKFLLLFNKGQVLLATVPTNKVNWPL